MKIFYLTSVIGVLSIHVVLSNAKYGEWVTVNKNEHGVDGELTKDWKTGLLHGMLTENDLITSIL